MKKIFEKYETFFSILLIILYILINSYCIQSFGIYDFRSVVINTIFSIILIILIIVLKRIKYYGLVKVEGIKKYLYFIPLFLIVSVNLWSGININNSLNEIIFYVLNMLNIGFIEEIIFRGFLFKMMEKDNVNSAIAISSITFGIGHIINLFHGALFIPTLLQIFSAISIGYLFVIIFYKSSSLFPAIITHFLLNALSIFNSSNYLYIESLFLIIVPFLYAMYIKKEFNSFFRIHLLLFYLFLLEFLYIRYLTIFLLQRLILL